MKFLELTLPTIPENLALDEALLESSEPNSPVLGTAEHAGSGEPLELQGKPPEKDFDETLRVWHANSVFIVLGRSSKVDIEVDRAAASEWQAGIYRRISGGATIVAAPGCMFYSVILDLEKRPHLRMLDEAHRFVMARMVKALQAFQPEVKFDGTCDLVLRGRKVSGNAVRIGRDRMLYHGTLLLDMDVQWVGRLLKHPPREPEYRAGRDHLEFVGNLGIDPGELVSSLREVWQASEVRERVPSEVVKRMVKERYDLASWNFQR